MIAKIEAKIVPFDTPNCVRVEGPTRPRQDGFKEALTIPLSDLSPETLEALCDHFADKVFRKAGKKRPDKKLLEVADDS